jgi:hypothetical protein
MTITCAARDLTAASDRVHTGEPVQVGLPSARVPCSVQNTHTGIGAASAHSGVAVLSGHNRDSSHGLSWENNHYNTDDNKGTLWGVGEPLSEGQPR